MSIKRSHPIPLAHFRPSRRRGVRWPTWMWAAGVWVWMAQVVMQRDGGFGSPMAQAAMGVVADELTPEWAPPVPAYRPKPLPAREVAATPAREVAERLTQRGPAWISLSASLREGIDRSVVPAVGRACWRRVVVEGTGESAGGAKDLEFALRRRPADGAAAPGFHGAHFVINNGSRAADGGIERTSRPLAGESLVVALVGDFSHQEPTVAQLRALTELVDYTRAKTGVIPVVVGDASRAPLAPSVLQSAFNAGLAGDPAAGPPRS